MKNFVFNYETISNLQSLAEKGDIRYYETVCKTFGFMHEDEELSREQIMDLLKTKMQETYSAASESKKKAFADFMKNLIGQGVVGDIEEVILGGASGDSKPQTEANGISNQAAHIVENVSLERRRINNRSRWCLIFTINGEKVPVSMRGNQAFVLYLCTLIKQKSGNRLYRNSFTHPTRQDKQWFSKVYRFIYINSDSTFEDWFARYANDNYRSLNQAKCTANREITNSLKAYHCEESTYHLVLKNEGNRRYYSINITPQCIELPEELFDNLDNYISE